MHRPVGMYPTAFGKPPPASELGPLNNLIVRGPPVPIAPTRQTAAYLENIVCSIIYQFYIIERRH